MNLLPDVQQADDAKRPSAVTTGSGIPELRQVFVFQDDSAVVSFLRDHGAISQLLLQAVPYLHQHFGRDHTVSLSIDSDEGGSRLLYAVIPWKGTAGAARAALHNFDDSWWMAHAFKASGRLTFTYELIE